MNDGKQVKLSQVDKAFRQILSLAPPFKIAIPPELPKLGSYLVGPVTDLLTFYVDETLAIRQPTVRKPGNHIYLHTSVAASWPTGQDCIDFDVTLTSLDMANQVGSIKVSHVPPSKICISTPAG